MTDFISRRREFSASIRHLKVFESVAHLQGFQRASEECHLSQPAVTQAIAKLEEQLGVALLVRRASGSYLNEVGVVFHRRMQRLFAQMEQALLDLGVPAGPLPLPQLAARISRSQIRSLIAIAENGSFAQAARALDISQTSLQRSARDLERILRTPLYNQTASGVVATQAAVEFARKLKLALREIDWGVDEVEAARGNIGGEIIVGAMLLSGSVVIASVIDEFVSTYSNADVRIINGNTEDLLKELRAGDVDVVIGLLRQQRSEGLIHRPLAETPYVIVGRHDHPLTARSHVTLDDLCGFDWIIGTPGSSRRALFDRLFAGRQRPRARIETSSLPTIRMLLSQSDRLTLLTSYELMYEEDTLAAVPFGPIEPVPCIGLTTRENWLPTELQTSFIELVQKRIEGSLMPVRALTKGGERPSGRRRPAPIGAK
jgi:LysR family transcriptional regulator, regulator for genes of the gallate degradation pathway